MQLDPAKIEECADRLARRALFGFVVTFIISRAVVFLIMAGRIPNLFLFMHDTEHTHVHHLNYGIFLLSAVSGYVLFAQPKGRRLEAAALIYGLALALTFDEFGMWLHLGGSYWQRVSVDAVIIVAALIGLIAYAPSLRRFESHHFWSFIVVVLATAGFIWVMLLTGKELGRQLGPALLRLEEQSSP